MTEVAEAPTQVERAAAVALGLSDRGYYEVTEFEGLRAGARVRHTGEQWPLAYLAGTAVVAHVMVKRLRGQGDPDIEIIIIPDGLGQPRSWQHYHAHLVTVRPTTVRN